MEVSALQAVLNNAGSVEVEIPQGGVIPFNQVLSSSGTDIIFDSATSTFTINNSKLNNIYLINWWIFVGGSESIVPAAFALNVGSAAYLTAAPWVEGQLSGSTLVVVEADENPIQVSLTNASGNAITIADVVIQAQINIIGFSRAN